MVLLMVNSLLQILMINLVPHAHINNQRLIFQGIIPSLWIQLLSLPEGYV